MIFNISSGGESYINVTAPSGSQITATIAGETVTGTGSCTLPVHIVGTWSVSCTIGGLTKTVNVAITSFGETKTQFFAEINVTVPGGTVSCDGLSRTGSGSIPVAGTGTKTVSSSYDGASNSATVNVVSGQTNYSVNIPYVCTVVVYTTAGAYVTISKSGYSSQSGTATNGSISFSVYKSGTWNITAELGRNTRGATSKTATVNAVYNSSASASCYPRLYIYRFDNANGQGIYQGLGGFNIFDADGNMRETLDLNYPYGGWKIARYSSYDSGNNVVAAIQSINLAGYTKMYMYYRYLDAYEIMWGVYQSGQNIYDPYAWTRRGTIKQAGTRADSYWGSIEMSISDITQTCFPIVRNLGGSSDLSADLEIQEWYLE